MSNQKNNNPPFITRREALKRGFLGATSIALASPFSRQARSAPLRPSAHSVIQIWMWGGPSHLDTFDPKPGAGYDYCGPYDKPIPTNVDGIQICQMLPLLAQQADKYSIILKGYEHGYKGLVPPYIVLTQPQGRFSEAGFLGPRYKPFATGGDPNRTPFAVEGIVAKGISDQRQRNRRELLHSLDSLGKAMPDNPHFKLLDRCEEKAYDLMFGDARKLFDLSDEHDEIRDRYGRNTFGQSCLMARRLVEHGVPYVTINYKGWDTHKQHFETMRQKLPEMDAGMATLLSDLADRGLLETTILWWGGEFGRTPKIQWAPPWNGGRGHYGKCFCAVVAGGGFKGGHVVGASNENGTEVAERPVYPQNLIGSIYELLGIDPDGPLPNPRGLEVQVMPASEQGCGRLREIM